MEQETELAVQVCIPHAEMSDERGADWRDEVEQLEDGVRVGVRMRVLEAHKVRIIVLAKVEVVEAASAQLQFHQLVPPRDAVTVFQVAVKVCRLQAAHPSAEVDFYVFGVVGSRVAVLDDVAVRSEEEGVALDAWIADVAQEVLLYR